MKGLLNVGLMVFLAVFVFSCKEKTVDTAGDVAATEGQKYEVGAGMGSIVWVASKPTGNHNGTINTSEGQIFVKDGKITSGNFTIDMTSITVLDLEGDEKTSLEAHLKGTESEGAQDFFNSTKFPTGKFEITSVIDSTLENGANTLVKGNLTLLDVTKEIAIPATVTVSDSTVVVVSPGFNINRTDWGITYKSKNVFKELGDKFINDEIALTLKLDAKAAPAEEKK
jgi:polyisoprenoid-binding protein YceI